MGSVSGWVTDAADDAALGEFLADLKALGEGDAPAPSAELAALLGGATPIATATRRRTGRHVIRRTGIAAAAVVAAATGLAATHSLPQPAQRLVSDVVSDLTPFNIGSEPGTKAPHPAPAPHHPRHTPKLGGTHVPPRADEPTDDGPGAGAAGDGSDGGGRTGSAEDGGRASAGAEPGDSASDGVAAPSGATSSASDSREGRASGAGGESGGRTAPSPETESTSSRTGAGSGDDGRSTDGSGGND